MQTATRDEIIAKALEFGASLAGIAASVALAAAPSYRDGGQDAGLSAQTSVLVLALAHPANRPELDWWDGNRGTAGNRQLIETGLQVCNWLAQTAGIDAGDLPYHLEAGGIFLKDAAVLAGLGVIGQNNLLISPQFGPRLRLRALLIDIALTPSPPLRDFSPCTDCHRPCKKACPRKAFSAGPYARAHCRIQMETDQKNRRAVAAKGTVKQQIRYCRQCELACPVGAERLSE